LYRIRSPEIQRDSVLILSNIINNILFLKNTVSVQVATPCKTAVSVLESYENVTVLGTEVLL
jgi:hypothetical protein